MIGSLVEKMEKASESLNFEAAARYRDQINALRKVQERQWVAGTQDEMDVLALRLKATWLVSKSCLFAMVNCSGAKHFSKSSQYSRRARGI